jgi:hypothetical protein
LLEEGVKIGPVGEWTHNFAAKPCCDVLAGPHLHLMLCSRKNDAVADEIVSPQFLIAWERMGVKYQIMDPIPDTNWTRIAGGRSVWWGELQH